MKKSTDIKDFYRKLITNKNLKLDINLLDEDEKNLYHFITFYQKTKKLLEKEIKEYNEKFLIKGDNPIIKDLIRNFNNLNSDGKYIRGTLIALSYLDNNFNNDNYYLPLAISYEIFQTAILIHDDIIDKANYRRGKETIPYHYNQIFKTYSNQTENFLQDSSNISNFLGLCIGDLGFYLANQVIYEKYYENPNFSELLKVYNQIVIDTIKGEILDVKLPFDAKYNNNLTKEEEIVEIYRLKTAHYTILGPYMLGITLNGFEISNNLKKALENIGIAFQIKDDILGIYSNSEIIGKSNFSDIIEYKQTLLYSYTLSNPNYKDKLLKYYGKSNITNNDLEKVRQIFKNSGSYDYAIEKMNNLFEKAKSLIKKDKTITVKTKQILLGLIIYLQIREK